MDSETLQWLNDHTKAFEEVMTSDSESQLLATPATVGIKSLEQFQSQPNRVKAAAALDSVDSFCDYVNRFMELNTTIYMHMTGMTGNGGFVAVLDHHGKDEPSWTDHTAMFMPKRSVEWEAWTGIHGRKLSQVELAEFIERNLNDIHQPEPSVMLQAALAFEANENLTLASSMNLDDGTTKFQFTKENVNKSVTFPHRITIVIPVFENDAQQSLDVRIRYKTNSDGVLTFTIWLVDNHDRIERDTMLGIARIIREKVDVLIYEGKPNNGYRT